MRVRNLCRLIQAVTLLAVLSVSVRAQSPRAGDSTSTLSGVYTDEQAKRGKEVYLNLCKSCHAPSTGNTFAKRWAGKTILDLFTYIFETMPDNNPRSVSESDNADVISYMLQVTGMPAGQHELHADADSLKAIRIEMKKEGPPPGGTLRELFLRR